GWGGDRYTFYMDAARERGTLVHVSRWDSERDAEEFVAAYAARIGKRYGVTEEKTTSPVVRQWKTEVGLVRIEQHGARVVAVEGFRGSNPGPLVRRLTQS